MKMGNLVFVLAASKRVIKENWKYPFAKIKYKN
jgi:hypothetical protein